MRNDWKVVLPEYNYELNARNATLEISSCPWTSGKIELELNDQEYLNLVCSAIEEIKKGRISKIVLSRIIKSKCKSVNSDVVFLLKNKFPSACAFYVPISSHEVWFGATPELLLEGKNGKWKTRSIAGTRLKGENKPWGEKELNEQQLVTSGISEALLAGNAMNIRIEKPYTYASGSIEHVCCEIEFEYSGDIDAMLRLIHPSAAVLGKPKNESQLWLTQFEPHNREWYTGYMKLQHNHTTYVYVFLRCGKSNSRGIHWYVGGGITAESIPESEVQETIHKANSLEQVLSSQM